jgi:FkbM family methyltransferase
MTMPMMDLSPGLMIDHLRRWQRARRLGLRFYRRAAFQLPSEIVLGDRVVALDLLDEHGTRADFIGIFLSNMYMIEKLKEIDSVVDVGANQGLFSVYARSLYPSATIHAYEPNAEISDRLRANCSQSDVTVFMEAVGAADGHCRLQLLGDSNLTRTVAAEAGDTPVTSIRTVIDRIGDVDLLKLDCEGCEWEILKEHRSLRHVRFIAMEYHCWASQMDHDDVPRILHEAGFRIIRQVAATDFGQALAERL